MNKNQTQILDCTLRDGGYYVDWNFERKLVQKYLFAMATSGINIVEIGFRFLSQKKFLGPYAYTTDNFIDQIKVPKEIKLSVMINASDLIRHEKGFDFAVNKLFREKKQSKINIVRIATHAADAKSCKGIAEKLSRMGYSVMLNLMQVDQLAKEKLINISKEISSWRCVDVFYFADSFGNMDSDSVKNTIGVLSKDWNNQIGFHAHDNKGQALSNCITALKAGVAILDSTVSGMGRGAGNVRTEYLLVEMAKFGYTNYYPDAVFPLVLQEFDRLKKKYNWGTNIYYFLSAVYGIHPTYVQEMLSGEFYDTEQILSTINFLKSANTPHYSFETLLLAMSGMLGSEDGEWNAANWARDSDVLIITSGPGSMKHIDAIQSFIEERNPIVLCLNINSWIPKKLVSSYIACNEVRLLMEADQYADLKKPLILPQSRLPKIIKEKLEGIEILDYGMRIEKNTFRILENGCVLDSSLALFYAISVATMGKAKRILLAGVDGYHESDPRHHKVASMFKDYESQSDAIPIYAITPSIYPINKRSVYDPTL